MPVRINNSKRAFNKSLKYYLILYIAILLMSLKNPRWTIIKACLRKNKFYDLKKGF